LGCSPKNGCVPYSMRTFVLYDAPIGAIINATCRLASLLSQQRSNLAEAKQAYIAYNTASGGRFACSLL
jgi:hypothetical protein